MSWFRKLPDTYQGILAGLGLIGLGAGGMLVLLGFIGLPSRVEGLESWQIRHDSAVTEPGLARIDALEVQLDSTVTPQLTQIRSMVYELYCDRFPDRCEAMPRPGGEP